MSFEFILAPAFTQVPAHRSMMPPDDPFLRGLSMGLVSEFEAGRQAGAVAAPGVFDLGDRTFVLPPAAGADFIAWHTAARDAVRGRMADPIAVLNAKLNEMGRSAADGGEPVNPALVKVLASAALTAQSDDDGQGRPEPTDEQLFAWCLSMDGVRWWAFYRLARHNKDVTREWVARHVTEETWGDVTARLGKVDQVRAVHPEPPTPMR